MENLLRIPGQNESSRVKVFKKGKFIPFRQINPQRHVYQDMEIKRQT